MLCKVFYFYNLTKTLSSHCHKIKEKPNFANVRKVAMILDCLNLCSISTLMILRGLSVIVRNNGMELGLRSCNHEIFVNIFVNPDLIVLVYYVLVIQWRSIDTVFVILLVVIL